MRYEAPETIKEAVGLLTKARGQSRILAGGTDLMVQMRSGMIEPDLILDIKRIPGMRDIVAEKGGFRVGAAVSGAELGEHAKVSKMWPGVVEATELIGSTQIQGRATMVGNLCNASPAADSVPALIAVGATARIVGNKRTRDIPVETLAKGPGKTILAKGEFVSSVFLPKALPRTGSAYLRFIPRTEMDIAVVGSGVCLTLSPKGVVTRARVSLGAVAARALLVEEAADVLLGNKLNDDVLERLAAVASDAATPINDKRGTVDFRKQVAGVLTRRAALLAFQRAKG